MKMVRSKTRVLHIVPALFGDGGIFGGAERYAFELAREMAKVVPTSLLAYGDRPQNFTTEDGLGVEVLSPPWYVRRQRANPIHPGLIRAIMAADVIHCHQPYTLSAEISALFGAISGRRVFASDLGGGGWGLSSRFQTDNWFCGHLHISEYARQVAGQKEWKNSKVIYGGVDLEKFSPDCLIEREPVVVYAGRLMPHKGVNYLIDALPKGLRLELIGRPYNSRYLNDLKKRAEGKAVTFRSDCDDAELIKAYRRALCVVLPSVYRDCYGNESLVPELLGQTLIEAMACATPTICTDVASMPEVVSNGVTGFIVPPNNAEIIAQKLEFLRDNKTQAIAMGVAARKRVESHFNWKNVVSSCLEAYTI